MALITFSTTRTFNLGELELAQKAAQGDVSAAIDLMVRRSDPPVTREDVCSLDEGEMLECMQELGKTVGKLGNMRKLFGGE